MLIFKRKVSPSLSAKVQQARQIYTSAALEYHVSFFFRADYTMQIVIILAQSRVAFSLFIALIFITMFINRQTKKRPEWVSGLFILCIARLYEHDTQ